MDGELSMPEKLRANAAVIVATFREHLETELTFDEAGVKRVDAYIERMRFRMGPDKRWGLVSTLASFVGECIIHTCGGEWTEKDGLWGVQINERLWACPFAKIEKQFDNGPEDSVASFFRSISALDQHLAQDAGAALPAVKHQRTSPAIVFHFAEEAGAALPAEASAHLSIQFDRMFFLVDSAIDVSVNGRLIGSGSFKTGISMKTIVPPGEHIIGLKITPRIRTFDFDDSPVFEISIPQSGSYIVQLIYSRWTGFRGKYKLTRVGDAAGVDDTVPRA